MTRDNRRNQFFDVLTAKLTVGVHADYDVSTGSQARRNPRNERSSSTEISRMTYYFGATRSSDLRGAVGGSVVNDHGGNVIDAGDTLRNCVQHCADCLGLIQCWQVDNQ